MNLREVMEKSLMMEFASMLVYQELAGKVIDDDAREVLRFLARGEESHVARLVDVFSSRLREGGERLEEIGIIKAHRSQARDVLECALRERGVGEDSPVLDILEFAREAERHAFDYYMKLAEIAEDEELSHLFRDLAEEEKNHEVSVIRLKDLFS